MEEIKTKLPDTGGSSITYEWNLIPVGCCHGSRKRSIATRTDFYSIKKCRFRLGSGLGVYSKILLKSNML